MSIKPSHTLLAALAVIAAPAFAQDAAAPATDAQASETATTQQPAELQDSTAAPAADAAAATDGSTAETTDATATPAPDAAADAPAAADAAPAEPKVGEYYLKSTQQDWVIRCIKAEQGSDPCELYQLMKDAEGNSVAELTMIPLSNGEVAAGATLVAPLETDLLKGLGVAIDGGQARGYPFSFCAPVGCVSRIGFTEAELNQLKRGNKGTVTLLPFGADPKNPVSLTLSLSGFTAAFDELTKSAAEAREKAKAAAETGAAATPTE